MLVVDSDPRTRMAAIRTLMGAGYQLSLAEDAWAARTITAAESPDLVLLGDAIARSAGLASVTRLLWAEETAHIPILAVADDAEVRDAADRAGVRAVIAGPPDDATLLAAVAEHIAAPGALSQAPESVLSDADRLAAVAALRFDASEQEVLDRFTALAAEMLQVPVSTISLIERDRQVWASQVGLSEPWASSGSSPLEYSYCQYTVTSREPLRIDDATRHPLVRDSPAIPEMDVVSYLGIPIITDDDQAVGSLCAIDSRPRQWSDREVKMLGDLGEILTDHLNAGRSRPGRHSAV